MQSFNPAPRAGAEREAWKAGLLAARRAGTSEPMRAFLESGMAPGIKAQLPEVLAEYAWLLHFMLRTDEERICVKQALFMHLLTTDTWSLEQKAALDGDGIPFEGKWPAVSPCRCRGWWL